MAVAFTVGELDPAGFDAVLNAHRRRLYGIAYSILRSHAEAEDALQDVLLKAWRAWPTLRDKSTASPWLTRICVNHCIDHRRRLWVRRTTSSEQDHPSGEDLQLRGPFLDLDRAFRKLSRQQRAAITLHNHYGYSIDECAAILGCGSGSVRTHIARALAHLRKEMTK